MALPTAARLIIAAEEQKVAHGFSDKVSSARQREVAVALGQTETMIWDLESLNHCRESLLVLRNFQKDLGKK